MPQNDVDHRQHRQRLKERFLQEGLDSFDPVNILELMLFYAIPQGDTNPTAHRLLDTFGSLSGVMNASVENLCQVKGVGQHAATLIKMCIRDRCIVEICRRKTKKPSFAVLGGILQGVPCQNMPDMLQ